MSRMRILIGLIIGLTIASCGAYSFTGANLAPEIQSISIDLFPNRSNGGPAAMSQIFTDALKDKFINETNLKLVDNDGNLQFSGSITGYRFSSQAPTVGETSAVNKLSISVKVDYLNTLDDNDKWTQTFTKEARYSSTEELSTLEESLIEEINTELVDEIFNKALVKW